MILDDAIDSAADMANLEDYKIKTYKKAVDPFDVFVNGFLENINIKMDVDPRLELINSTLSKHLKVIDPSKEKCSGLLLSIVI